MSRRRIYLMRHAQVRYFEGLDPREVVLTEAGRHQAAAARDALQEVQFDRVVTSGLPRTLETARIVAPYANHERDHDLREIESGELRGVDPNEFDPLDPANMSPVVVALCADEAQQITGQVFHVWGSAVNALRGWSAGELFQKEGRWDADELLQQILERFPDGASPPGMVAGMQSAGGKSLGTT